MTIWLGMDPGPRNTGLTLRDGATYLGHRVVIRTCDESPILVGRRYIDEISVAADVLIQLATSICRAEGATLGGNALESAQKPNIYHDGQKRVHDPIVAMGLAAVWGALVARFDVVQVPPGKNGQQALGSYPVELLTAQERKKNPLVLAKPGAKVSHAKSAWDVAGVAMRAGRRAA